MALTLLLGELRFPMPSCPIWACPASGDTEAHSHDFVEVVLVTGGRSKHVVYDPQGRPHSATDLKENDMFLLRPFWGHEYHSSQDFGIQNLLFSPKYLAEAWPDEAGHAELALQRGQGHIVQVLPPERERLEACMRAVMLEIAARAQEYQVMAHARLMEFLVLANRVQAARRQGLGSLLPPPESSPAVSRAIIFMESRLTQDLTLDAIARAAHLSPHYFCEVFKVTTGLTPGQYLNQLRIEHAKNLLSTRDLSIGEVALQCGFPDSSYFARVFKKSVGTSPRAYQATGK